MELTPFKPCVYNRDIKGLTSPPFDGITPDQERDLKSNLYNITHLTLPRGPDGVGKAREKLESWLRNDILRELKENTIFILVQNFRLNSENIERIGIIGETRVYPADGVIRPHEETFPGPVEERAALLKGMEAQLEPLFLTVLNNNFDRVLRRAISGAKPGRIFEEPIGVSNSVYFVTDSDRISKISEVIANDKAIVADGHHRLKAAQRLAASSTGPEKEFWSRSMVYITSIYDRGLLISGVHRTVDNGFSLRQNADRLSSLFEVKDKKNLDTQDSIVIYDGSFRELIPRKSALELLYGSNFDQADVIGASVLNEILFKKTLNMKDKDLETSVQYTHDVSLAVGKVDSGISDFAAIMPPWNKDVFIKHSMEERVMPQKSTYFYPKIPSGIAIRKFNKQNY